MTFTKILLPEEIKKIGYMKDNYAGACRSCSRYNLAYGICNIKGRVPWWSSCEGYIQKFIEKQLKCPPAEHAHPPHDYCHPKDRKHQEDRKHEEEKLPKEESKPQYSPKREEQSELKQVFKKPKGERTANLSNRYKLAAIGMGEILKKGGIDTTHEWKKIESRFEGIKDQLGMSFSPARFPIDVIDDENKICWEVKTISKDTKDAKLRWDEEDSSKKEMVARALGYRLKTKVYLCNDIIEEYEKDGYGGWRPRQMERIR